MAAMIPMGIGALSQFRLATWAGLNWSEDKPVLMKSECGPRRRLDGSLTRIRLQSAIYFCLHRGKCPRKGGRMASLFKLIELARVLGSVAYYLELQ